MGPAREGQTRTRECARAFALCRARRRSTGPLPTDHRADVQTVAVALWPTGAEQAPHGAEKPTRQLHSRVKLTHTLTAKSSNYTRVNYAHGAGHRGSKERGDACGLCARGGAALRSELGAALRSELGAAPERTVLCSRTIWSSLDGPL